MWAIRLPSASLNQIPSARDDKDSGRLCAEIPVENAVICPSGVIRPMLSALEAENQMLPSIPKMIPLGPAHDGGKANSVITPDNVMRPILSPASSVNHMHPSLPAMIPKGWLDGLGSANSANS